MTVRHLLGIAEHGADGLRRMLELSVAPDLGSPLAGRGVALIFEKPSNRTRHSMEMAVVGLGGHPVYTRGEEVGLDVRETVEDATRTLAGYHAVLAARVFSHSVVVRMAAVSPVPVINMLSDLSHPLQALADVITMQEKVGALSGVRVAWVGDWNNVARSLAEAVCLLGGTVAIACPVGYDASDAELTRIAGLGGRVEQHHDAPSAVENARFVHTDTWISMGQEAEAAARRETFAPFTVDEALMARAASDAWFMHCMPAHRGEEVSAGVFDGDRSLVIAQGHHRLTGARGALAWVCAVG
ncbi:MAG: ornithine carbamoyltransferase [Actinobacteria bacterium]|nr:ornithine carbamoyltransferase [Actinomycetota bacterium]